MVLMEKLSDLSELDAASIELLEAVGVDRITALAKSSGEHLLSEMARANSMLRIRPENPDALEISRWINAASEQVGGRADGLSFVKPVQASTSAPLVEPVLEAIGVPAQRLVDGGISVADVPIMEKFLTEEELVAPVEISPAPESENAEESDVSVGTDARKVRVGSKKTPFSLPKNDEGETVEGAKIEPLKGKGPQLATAPLPETNAGKKEHSRSYIRGVLHPQPFKIYLGAFVSIMTITLFPLSFVALVMIMLKQPLWWAAVPAAAIIFGLLHLMFAAGSKCRICGQPMFTPKRCHKHVKAHHVPLMGYILPTSVQLILYKWFRCIYCGTSIRLKE